MRPAAHAAGGLPVPNEVVLFRAHYFTQPIVREIRRLRAELPGCDHHVVGYIKEGQPYAQAPAPHRHMYRRADLAALPYPQKIARTDWDDPTGDNDLPCHAFYRERPDFDFYWIVEYDVRYTGHWGKLFAELRTSAADLLATTIQDQEDNPFWCHWDSLVDVPGTFIALVRSFLPFCRLSNRALEAIDRWYRAGGAGHYEMTWPSVCKAAGLTIQDIGGEGPYTPAKWRGKHYRNSPMEG
jgi:hypothetical protein